MKNKFRLQKISLLVLIIKFDVFVMKRKNMKLAVKVYQCQYSVKLVFWEKVDGHQHLQTGVQGKLGLEMESI